MLPRSLSNFMNAFTSSDHTTYPFATTNHKDFNNLLSVYIDATLRPLLKNNDFLQEGWRIGPNESSTDAADGTQEPGNNQLTFKGVVYNEMKGQMSDASYLFYIKFQERIFPELHNSGGDPQRMTDLSHKMLADFHHANYHPSRAKIFTYGDMSMSDHLQKLDRELSQFRKSNNVLDIKLPIGFSNSTGPSYQSVKGPLDPLVDKQSQHKTSTSWLAGDGSDILQTFSLGIVSSLLLDGYGSPMYQALIESGLGTDFSPNTGFDTSARKNLFTVGLVGVKPENVPDVKAAVQSKLKEVCKNGFDRNKIEGLLHQLELALKHKTANFGLGLMQRLEPGWFNGIDPMEMLAWNEVVSAFQQELAEGPYLEALVEEHLLNDHTFTFTMEPSETYADDLRAEESSRLSSKLQEVPANAENPTKVYENFAHQEASLLQAQSKASNEDLSCLPRVYVSDIPRSSEKKITQESTIGNVPIQLRRADTNGLTYFRAINTLHGLPADLRLLMPLFSASIMRLGTKDKTIEEIEDLIKLKTGGIGLSYHASPSPSDMCKSSEGISLSGYALDKNVPDMYEILRMLIQETNFDGPHAEEQLRQLIQQDASGALDAIANGGHGYASRYAQAGLTTQGLLNEQLGGLTQVQHTAKLANLTSEESLSDVIAKLKIIQNSAMSKGQSVRAALNCGSEASAGNETALNDFLSKFPVSTTFPESDHTLNSYSYQKKTFFPLPYQVYYSALSLPTVSFVDSAGAPLQILAQLLTHKHLHHEIREKGGAYGGGASAGDLSGFFNFYSYRDPNPQNTLQVMQNAGSWARDRDWTAQDIEDAKLSTFQNVDAPQSVSDEGMVKFVSGITDEMEQTKREQLLDVTKHDIKEVAQRFLIEGLKGNGRIALLGEKNDWATSKNGWSVENIDMNAPSEFADANDVETVDSATG